MERVACIRAKPQSGVTRKRVAERASGVAAELAVVVVADAGE